MVQVNAAAEGGPGRRALTGPGDDAVTEAPHEQVGKPAEAGLGFLRSGGGVQDAELVFQGEFFLEAAGLGTGQMDCRRDAGHGLRGEGLCHDQFLSV